MLIHWDGSLDSVFSLELALFGFMGTNQPLIHINNVKHWGYELGLNITPEFNFLLTESKSMNTDWYLVTLVEK